MCAKRDGGRSSEERSPAKTPGRTCTYVYVYLDHARPLFLRLSSFAQPSVADYARHWKKRCVSMMKKSRFVPVRPLPDLPLATAMASPDSMNSALVVTGGGRDEQWFAMFGGGDDSAGGL